jgi:glyoxylase-like metal-dependent hydrolase (beta-lactamase superfamily II)
MLIKGFPAGSWATNCYVLAMGPGEPALIIDPGQDSIDAVHEILEKYRLRPAGVLLTHGHIDHIWSVAPLGKEFGIPALIHAEDRYRLADPAGSSFAASRDQLMSMTKGHLELTEPDQVEVIDSDKELNLVGLDLEFIHAPGHTEGSMVIRNRMGSPAGLDRESDGADILFSGDVLFQGSIGRTDLPGGNPIAMSQTLESVILPMADSTIVLPGHGAQTTIGAERFTNPFLSTGRGL